MELTRLARKFARLKCLKRSFFFAGVYSIKTLSPIKNFQKTNQIKSQINSSSQILQHSQNGPTADRQVKLKNTTIQILGENSTKPSCKQKYLAN